MNKKVVSIIIISIIIIGVASVCTKYIFNGKKIALNESNLIVISSNLFSSKSDYDFNHNATIFTNYRDYYSKLQSNKLSENDFIVNNYIYFKISHKSCREEYVKPSYYTLDGNNIEITVNYKLGCCECVETDNYYLLKVDKKITTANVEIKYKYKKDLKTMLWR